jgi:citrate synthase
MRNYVTSREAIALLDVKLQTLYAYVSRGLIHSAPVNDGSKERLYLRADIEKLRLRAEARSGHGAVAADAMHYGQPVITSEITELTADGPRYRGYLATDLAESVLFENVARLLWTGTLDVAVATTPQPHPLPANIDVLCRDIYARYGNNSILRLFATYVFACGMDEPDTGHQLAALRLMYGLTGFFGYLGPRKHYRAPEPGESIAQAVLHACGLDCDEVRVRALNAALVILADYELASATFVARVAASSGADINACIVAAIESSSGWVVEHRRVERLLDSVTSEAELKARLEPFRDGGDLPPGFQPNLYASHDPRTAPLLDLARRGRHAYVTDSVTAFLAGEAERVGLHAKAMLGLEVFARAMNLPRGAVPGVFLLARTAGWVAHILEQYTSDTPLRPRAKFVSDPNRVGRFS